MRGRGSTPEWGALIPTEAERGMKGDEVYPCLPPCVFTWEWQYSSQTLSFGSGTPGVFMFLLLQHLICFGLFSLSRLRRLSVLVFLLCSLEREGVGSSISQLSLTQDLSHKSKHQNVFAMEAGLFFHYPPYYQIHCSQAKCGEPSLLKAVQTVQVTLTNYTLNHTVVVIPPSAAVGSFCCGLYEMSR